MLSRADFLLILVLLVCYRYDIFIAWFIFNYNWLFFVLILDIKRNIRLWILKFFVLWAYPLPLIENFWFDSRWEYRLTHSLRWKENGRIFSSLVDGLAKHAILRLNVIILAYWWRFVFSFWRSRLLRLWIVPGVPARFFGASKILRFEGRSKMLYIYFMLIFFESLVFKNLLLEIIALGRSLLVLWTITNGLRKF